MSWVTGTASDHNDLISRLVTFLTTDTTLVAAAQNWTALRQAVLPFTDALPGGRISFGNTNNAIVLDAWPLNAPQTNVRLKASGTLTAPSAGSYTFGLMVDDMAEVWIDGALVYGLYTPMTLATTFPNSFTTTLSAGTHTIEVRYIGFTTNNFLALGWKKPGDPSVAVIPAASFSGMTLAYNVTYGNNAGNQNSAAAFKACFEQQEVVLRGPGLAGADQIFVGLNTYVDYAGDMYNMLLRGFTGYNAALTMSAQPGTSSAVFSPSMLLWNQPMKYWFIADGRHFIVVAKVSTVYETMYAGFLLPYGLPTEIPYPLAVCAPSTKSDLRWSDQSSEHAGIWMPGSGSASRASVAYRNPSGAWEGYANFTTSSSPNGRIYPSQSGVSLRSDPSGSYALTPLTLYSTDNGGNAHGELAGVFHVSGFSNASENIITIGGVDHLVVQGAFRTAITDYGAIALQ